MFKMGILCLMRNAVLLSCRQNPSARLWRAPPLTKGRQVYGGSSNLLAHSTSPDKGEARVKAYIHGGAGDKKLTGKFYF